MANSRRGLGGVYRNRNLFDYSTTGGPIQEDFGEFGKLYLDGVKHIEEVKRSVDAQVLERTDEAIKLADAPITGNELFDRGAADLMSKVREDIYSAKSRIGKDGFTVNDYNQLLAKSMGSAASFTKLPQFYKDTRDAIAEKGDEVSGAQLSILDYNLGKVMGRGSVNSISVKDGSYVIDRGERDEKGNPVWVSTDIKEFVSSGPEDIAMFNKLDEAKTFRDIFVNKNKDFLPPELLDLDDANATAVITGHIVDTPENYKKLKETFVNEMSKHDIVSYLHDHMGYEPGSGSGKTYRVSNGSVVFDPENNEEDARKLKEVKDSFSQYLDETFGVETTKNAQIVRKGTIGGGSGSLGIVSTYGDAGGIVQRSSISAEDSDSLDPSGYGKKMSNVDYAMLHQIGTKAFLMSSEAQTPEDKIKGFNQSVDEIKSKSNQEIINEVMSNQQFKKSNPDLYYVEREQTVTDDSGNTKKINVLSPREERRPESLEDIYRDKTMEQSHMSLGLNLSKADVQAVVKTNSTGQELENISGITVTYRHGYTPKPGETEFDSSRVTKIPMGIRVVGQAEYQSTQVLAAGQPQKQSAITQGGVGLVSERSTTMSSVSKPLNKAEVQALTNRLIKADKNFQIRLAQAKQEVGAAFKDDPVRILIKALNIK